MLRTIRASREIDEVFGGGTRRVSRDIVVIVAPTPDGRGPSGRVAYLAGRKLGHAVVRNRAKRVLRASVQRLAGPWPGYDVLLVARSGTGVAAPDDIDEQVERALAALGVVMG